MDGLCAYDHCRIALPWFAWSRQTDSSSCLRRHILSLDYGKPLSSASLAQKTIAAALHFIRGTRELLIIWNRKNAPCTQGYGVSRWLQLRQLFIAVFRYNIAPSHYYRSRLFRLERSRWLAVFNHSETTLLLTASEQATNHFNIWNKAGWAAFCASESIRTVPIIAEAKDGTLHVHEPSLLQPGRDLFLKPNRDYSSRGAVMLEWDELAQSWQADGAITAAIPGDSLSEFLRSHSRESHLVVQPRMQNAKALVDLSSRALANIRIVTLQCPKQGASILMAGLRLPPGDQPTSDVIGSTICISIDITTGMLAQGESSRLELGPCSRHPHNNVQIEGRIIPEWPEMREQAIAAHRRLPLIPSIGWDLIATDSGVYILEANAVWHGDLAQNWGLAPLGETPWPELMLGHFESTSSGH